MNRNLLCRPRLQRHGFSIIEILVILVVLAVFLVGFFQFLNQSRSDTVKTTRYVQALHLAQEIIDLATTAPLDENHRRLIEQTAGSLVDPATGRAVEIPVASGVAWTQRGLTYPDHYNGAYFLRQVSWREIPGGPDRQDLTEITVAVSWSEGATPEHLEPIAGTGADPARTRTLELAALLLDERQPY